jgi:hypothetical protein
MRLSRDARFSPRPRGHGSSREPSVGAPVVHTASTGTIAIGPTISSLGGEVRHHQYVALDPCASAANFASLEHAIAISPFCQTQQLYPADGAQQGSSDMPPSLRGGGSCTPSVVQSQCYADHVVVCETTKQALFQSILKKEALKQEVERRTCTHTPRRMRRNDT